MNPWLIIGLSSGLIGAIVGAFWKGRRVVLMGALVPWVGMLCVLLYFEYVVPYSGGGASMWPIAQLVGGSVAAAIGGATAAFVSSLRRRG